LIFWLSSEFTKRFGFQMEIGIGKKIGEYFVEKCLGTGGFGSVYKVSKEDASGKYFYALKHITFPSPDVYNEISSSMNKNQGDIDAYFKGILMEIVAEFNTMRELSAINSRHFVSYYDHQIYGSSKRYDIFIRMELLVPVNLYCKNVALSVSDVIKLGMEIGEALKVCHQRRIIHRDVKEANLFINANGDFKLGDFGVAKTLDKTTQMMSRKGTPFYMAPEILLNQPYDFSADIYSLAIVLYRLLNKSRYPFLPPYPQAYTNQHIETAQAVKLTGQKPLRPCLAQNALGDVLVKALSSKGDRYKTAEEFIAELKKVKETLPSELLNAVVSEPDQNDSGNTVQRTNAFNNGQGISTRGTTVGTTGFNNKTIYGNENENVFNLHDKSLAIKTSTLTVKTNAPAYSADEKNKFRPQEIRTKKVTPLNILNFITPFIFAAIFIFYIDVLVRDILFGIPFFDNLYFRIAVLIVSGGLTVVFIIKILIYPDKKTLILAKESKKWRAETLVFLGRLDSFVDKKTSYDVQNRYYKNLKGELSELKRRVRECGSFWKLTYSSRQCEIEVSSRLNNLNNLITQKDYIISVGKNDGLKTMSDEKKSEFSLAVNNIKRLLEQRATQLQ